jgi:hypothetical protein
MLLKLAGLDGAGQLGIKHLKSQGRYYYDIDV